MFTFPAICAAVAPNILIKHMPGTLPHPITAKRWLWESGNQKSQFRWVSVDGKILFGLQVTMQMYVSLYFTYMLDMWISVMPHMHCRSLQYTWGFDCPVWLPISMLVYSQSTFHKVGWTQKNRLFDWFDTVVNPVLNHKPPICECLNFWKAIGNDSWSMAGSLQVFWRSTVSPYQASPGHDWTQLGTDPMSLPRRD